MMVLIRVRKVDEYGWAYLKMERFLYEELFHLKVQVPAHTHHTFICKLFCPLMGKNISFCSFII